MQHLLQVFIGQFSHKFNFMWVKIDGAIPPFCA